MLSYVLIALGVVAVVAVIVLIVVLKRSGSVAPPGWYPDPDDPNTQRYFNGREWIADPPFDPPTA